MHLAFWFWTIVFFIPISGRTISEMLLIPAGERVLSFFYINCTAKPFHIGAIAVFGNSFQVPKKNICCIWK